MVRGANYGVRDLSRLEPNLKFRGQAPTFQRCELILQVNEETPPVRKWRPIDLDR